MLVAARSDMSKMFFVFKAKCRRYELKGREGPHACENLKVES